MRATLTFELPEDRPELDLALRAGQLSSAVYEAYNLIRGYQKHEDPSLERAGQVLDQVRACLLEVMDN